MKQIPQRVDLRKETENLIKNCKIKLRKCLKK
jgi:hypothetical protein